MATIMDVAARAGVSMKTVSRILNNEPHVRPALRERVEMAIADLDYRPSLAARQLAARRSYVLSFIANNQSNSYYSSLIVAAASECRRYGYHLVSETFDGEEASEEFVKRIMANLRPDGIILPAPLCSDNSLIAAIERCETPLVRIAGTGAVYGDVIEVHERAISCELVTHLVALGHRRIAMIVPPPDHSAAAERIIGYKDALARAGLADDPALILVGDMSFAAGVQAAESLFALPDRPTAIFAANDGMALGVMAAARRRDFRIPDDIAIAGFDDSAGSRMVFPPLTTVRQPIADMARAAVLALLQRESSKIVLRHELAIRGSTTGSREMDLTILDA